ncbi:Rhodanese-like domain-containing protein 17 [Vitis vinifera]|uniref:Rhodanese-like domain-containing protein 17 n=1 Tax=Vitis vinifera TaxID=29760 RepID=A0A438EUX8_VITVI|nr:Rhodanese-like domain-containing protein 17 [Vitis vinifera]
MDSQSSATEVVTIDVHAAKDLINSGYRILMSGGLIASLYDWTVEEFKKGHADVENILTSLTSSPPLRNISKDDMGVGVDFRKGENPEFLEQGCQSGVRSLAATSVLVSAGFKDVKDIGGGYLAWVQNGLVAPNQKRSCDWLLIKHSDLSPLSYC